MIKKYDNFRKKHIDRTIIENGMILDIGCGDGHLFKNYKVIGIDIDKKILKMNPNKTIRLDVTKGLPFQDETIDQIYCLEFLEHQERTEDVIKILKEFYRVLKVNGSLIIHTPNKNRLNLQIRKLIGKPKKYPFPVCERKGRKFIDFHYWEFTKKEIKQLLNNCGFKSKIDEVYLNFAFISKWGIPIKTRFGRSLFIEAIKMVKK